MAICKDQNETISVFVKNSRQKNEFDKHKSFFPTNNVKFG